MPYDDETSEVNYQRRRRGVIVPSTTSSSSINTSESTLATSTNIPNHPNITPQSKGRSQFLALIRCIANSLSILEDYDFCSDASLELSSIDREPPEFIGKGKTFHVSKILLPTNIGLERSLPSKLVPRVATIYERRGSDVVTCKKPLIEFDSNGNPKDGALEKRLQAVILEVKILTHPPLYFHKNIVDFLGVNWQCELPELELGQPIPTGLPNRVPGILLEYAQHGSLADLRRTSLYTTMPFGGRASLCRDIAEGLAALHRCGIVHGDIKLDNILIFDANDSSGSRMAFGLRAKLADFGFSIGGAGRGDKGLDEVATWELAGRTWPWNDPEWNLPRTWNQLQKTDVFSYGLLAWTVLSRKELGSLFDFDENANRNDPELRKRVEELKDWTLSWNAASYFRGNKLVNLLAECLFECSLDPRAEKRGTMKEVLEIWDIWFMSDPPYQPIPQGVNISLDKHIEDIPHVHFQRIVRHLSSFPPSIKKQFANTYTDYSIPEKERLEAKIFRAFCHLIGWGVEKNPKEGKRLIDETAENFPSAAIFQPMFLDESRLEVRNLVIATNRGCTEYEQKVFKRLMAQASLGSYEAFRHLRTSFPTPVAEAYSMIQSRVYRDLKYGIGISDHPVRLQKETGVELCVYQWDDIEQNFWREEVVNLGHNVLHFAVFSGFAEVIKQILESSDFDPKSLEEKDYNGDTPLLASCRLGAFRAAKLLIGAGADVKAKNNYGETALHFLNQFDNPEELNEISGLVLSRGKELINTVSKSSYPLEVMTVMPLLSGFPLNRAILTNNIQLLKILLKYGANPLKTTPRMPSPLLIAASAHFTEALRLFFEACPNAQEWRSCELIEHAIGGFAGFQRMYLRGPRTQEMMKSTLDFLLDNVLLANTPLYIGDFPLISFAVMYGDEEMVDHIISRIGTATINTYAGTRTALHLAIMRGSSEMFKVLVKYGADPYLEMNDLRQVPSLELCCMHWGYTKQMMELLLEHSVRKEGDVTLELAFAAAVSVNNFEAASALLDAGANIDWEDENRVTVLGMVVRTCNHNTVTQLRFLLDHQVALGRKPAGFLAIPAEKLTPLHMIALIPSIAPLRDRKVVSSILDYLLARFGGREHVNAQDAQGFTALHAATFSSSTEVVQRLLRLDTIDLSLRSRRGKTAYDVAIEEIVGEIPKNFQEAGDHAVEQYKRDRVEIRNMFDEKLSDNRD